MSAACLPAARRLLKAPNCLCPCPPPLDHKTSPRSEAASTFSPALVPSHLRRKSALALQRERDSPGPRRRVRERGAAQTLGRGTRCRASTRGLGGRREGGAEEWPRSRLPNRNKPETPQSASAQRWRGAASQSRNPESQRNASAYPIRILMLAMKTSSGRAPFVPVAVSLPLVMW